VLFSATAGSNLPVIEYLVNAGLDINAVDNDNDTCLHLAAMLQNPALRKNTIDLLVRLGAKQNLRNKLGYTYKELLAMSAEHGGRGRHGGHYVHGGGMGPGMAQCPIS
jgi:ankyrin repeat protein